MSERYERVHGWLRGSYVVCVTLSIPASCALRLAFPADGWEDYVARSLIPLLVFQVLIAGLLVESAAWGGGAHENCQRFGALLARAVCGLAVLYLLLAYSA